MARKLKERKLKNPKITIIGEGATERFYFTHLKALRGYDYICKPRNFTQQTIDDIQTQAERVLADEGIAVCVFDVDVTRHNKVQLDRFEEFYRKYGNNENVIICESMPSIEFWFLLHFIKTNRYFASSDSVISVLRRYITNFSKQQSFLSKENWVSLLLSDDKLNIAVDNAKSISDNGESYSNIHRLFTVLKVL